MDLQNVVCPSFGICPLSFFYPHLFDDHASRPDGSAPAVRRKENNQFGEEVCGHDECGYNSRKLLWSSEWETQQQLENADQKDSHRISPTLRFNVLPTLIELPSCVKDSSHGQCSGGGRVHVVFKLS